MSVFLSFLSRVRYAFQNASGTRADKASKLFNIPRMEHNAMTRQKRRATPRVLRHLTPCPDCNAVLDADHRLVHEDTCPLSAGIDATCAEDAQWFRDHPDEPMRVRGLNHAEHMELGHIDPDGMPTHVHVVNHLWGRVRHFCDDNDVVHALVLDPDSGAA